MSAVTVGALRHRLALERPERTPDGAGGADVSWVEEGQVWAAIRPLRGEERVAADRLSGTLTHEITLRFRPDVTPAMRLRKGARVFRIDAAIDVEGRGAWLKCLCREEDL